MQNRVQNIAQLLGSPTAMQQTETETSNRNLIAYYMIIRTIDNIVRTLCIERFQVTAQVRRLLKT